VQTSLSPAYRRVPRQGVPTGIGPPRHLDREFRRGDPSISADKWHQYIAKRLRVDLVFSLSSFPTQSCVRAACLRTPQRRVGKGLEEQPKLRIQTRLYPPFLHPAMPINITNVHQTRRQGRRKKNSANLESDDAFVIDHEPRVRRVQILPHRVGIWEL
jgi:hypothetical protein